MLAAVLGRVEPCMVVEGCVGLLALRNLSSFEIPWVVSKSANSLHRSFQMCSLNRSLAHVNISPIASSASFFGR